MTSLNELAALCAILDDGRVPVPRYGWDHAEISRLLGLRPGALGAMVQTAAGVTASTPSTMRIDSVLDTLRLARAIPPGGWSCASLAVFANVSETSIQARINSALHTLRRKLEPSA